MTQANEPVSETNAQTVLNRVVGEFAADSGTIHLLGDDGLIHLEAASAGMPEAVLAITKSAMEWRASLSSAGRPSMPATFKRTGAALSGRVHEPRRWRERSSFPFSAARM